ncbi:hypothetical protein RFI_00282 [Reticulomyxa filosa]|uniref:Uncharacterized protein n=1 Tax=Reticulomyxa filosa TaxID=46433 RepID=X6PF02_RETFI|nr:hypothetical protein RFI_00282 [Reticulomyxa filosa]|eukprot:ETO36781.1 hypothetical protein RFI_00282 [Reticulomyxa filosa]
MSWKGIVTINSKDYEFTLNSLTIEELKAQITEISKVSEQKTDLIKITDTNDQNIETDQQVQQSLQDCQLHFFAYFQTDYHFLSISTQTLDFHKHWSIDWIKANCEAAKIVRQTLNANKQGLVCVVKSKPRWQIEANEDSVTMRSSFSVIALKSNDGMEVKQFGDYWVYLLKYKVVRLHKVEIDGNVYVIGCEIQCKDNVTITTQMIVTKTAIIDQRLKQSHSQIEWNAIIHHDVPLQLQELQDKAFEHSNEGQLCAAFECLQKAVKIAIDTFGSDHPYVADAYSNLGIAHSKQQKFDEALNCYEIAINICLKVFGDEHGWICNLNDHIGLVYQNQGIYDTAIQYHQRALKIRKCVFQKPTELTGDASWNLGRLCGCFIKFSFFFFFPLLFLKKKKNIKETFHTLKAVFLVKVNKIALKSN